jgi:hypothetical protein
MAAAGRAYGGRMLHRGERQCNRSGQRELDVISVYNLQLMITGAALALFTAAYVIIMHKNLVEQRKQRELLVMLASNLIKESQNKKEQK